MEDPSIRTHDPVFEQLLLLGGIVGAAVIVLAVVAIWLATRDRRY